jgi:hypothetical protein
MHLIVYSDGCQIGHLQVDGDTNTYYEISAQNDKGYTVAAVRLEAWQGDIVTYAWNDIEQEEPVHKEVIGKVSELDEYEDE